MTQETMTVHQGLAELKMLDKKIRQANAENVYVYYKLKASDTVKGVKVAEVSDKMSSAIQSISDHLKRYNAIKAAIVASNAVTKIVIGDASYTVADAIELKNHYFPALTEYRNNLVRQDDAAVNRVETNNTQARELAERQARETVKKDSGEGQIDTDVYEKLIKIQLEHKEMELVTPTGIKIESLIESLSNEIDDFTTNVDAALSVSNALTSITIEY